jgi:hypothetical protein
MGKEKLYRVECICDNEVDDGKKCGEFLMGSNEKPHLTAKELHKKWIGMVISAPLNAPRCPKCKYSTGSDYNAGTSFLIDDGEKKMTSEKWFKLNP